MRRMISIMIVVSMLWQPKAHAQHMNSHANPNETLAYVLLVAAFYGLIYFSAASVAHVIQNGEEYSEGRKGKYFLLEHGVAPLYGRSYAAGAFVSDNALLQGRYIQHLSPNKDVNFKIYEIAYRHYYKVVFGEVGLFNAKHRQFEAVFLRDPDDPGGIRHPRTYYFDDYETRGGFLSLGLALQVWRISISVRGTLHRGASIHTIETYENAFDISERLKTDARNEFRHRRTLYLDLGLSI